MFPPTGQCRIEKSGGSGLMEVEGQFCQLPLNHNYWLSFLVLLMWQGISLIIGLAGIVLHLPTLFSYKWRKISFILHVSINFFYLFNSCLFFQFQPTFQFLLFFPIFRSFHFHAKIGNIPMFTQCLKITGLVTLFDCK